MANADFRLLRDIYISFFKLGCVSFGGGYSMIPLIEREVVDNRKWVDKEKVVDIFAVAESLPGAIALNASTFVGCSVAGTPGAIAALLGNVTPSVVIVLVLSILFSKFSTYPEVKSAFRAIYPVIVGLILYAAYKIGRTAIKDIIGVFIAVAVFIASLFLHIEPIPLIIAGAVIGIAISCIKPIINAKSNTKISAKVEKTDDGSV